MRCENKNSCRLAWSQLFCRTWCHHEQFQMWHLEYVQTHTLTRVRCILTDKNSDASPDALVSSGYVMYNIKTATAWWHCSCGLNKTMQWWSESSVTAHLVNGMTWNMAMKLEVREAILWPRVTSTYEVWLRRNKEVIWILEWLGSFPRCLDPLPVGFSLCETNETFIFISRFSATFYYLELSIVTE